MSHYSRTNENDPPNSRLFVLTTKDITDDDLRAEFEPFGNIERITNLKDKSTNEYKGVSFIKFAKSSQACLAMEELHGKILNGRPMKVIIAQAQGQQKEHNFEENPEGLMRIFILVDSNATRESLTTKFSAFGEVTDVRIVNSRNNARVCAFIKFEKASSAALALELCEDHYKAVLAEPQTPKGSRKREIEQPHGFRATPRELHRSSSGPSLSKYQRGGSSMLEVLYHSCCPYDRLCSLFDIIPDFARVSRPDYYDIDRSIVTVEYYSEDAARHAFNKLHGFEFPDGCFLDVRLSFASMPPSRPSLYNWGSDPALGGRRYVVANTGETYTCTCDLPPTDIMHPHDDIVISLFVHCQPVCPPESILEDVFSRFGNMVLFKQPRGKNFGFARYCVYENGQKALKMMERQYINDIYVTISLSENRPSK